MNSINLNDTIKSWVMLYTPHLYTVAIYKTSDKETAEDLVQETFIAAVKGFEKFENKSEPKTWLLSILKNKIADHFRKSYRNQRDKTISIDHFFDNTENWKSSERPQNWEIADEQQLLDNTEFAATLNNCIDKLPQQWKASVMLKYLEEKKTEMVCKELEITATNYWQILHRAKLQLRKCLELNWFKG